MLTLNNLSIKRNNKLILKNINLTIPNAATTAIIGPSGIGKTTLISAICQLISYSGDILWDGHKLNLKKQTIAWVPQDFGLLPWFDVHKNISLGIKIRNNDKLNANQAELVEQTENKLGISDIKHKFPNELSGGQKQRVALAKAFCLKPEILLLDEPFSALDTVVKQTAENLLLEQLATFQITTLMITHSLEEALIFGDQLFVLSNKTGQLRENPLKSVNPKDRRDNPEFSKILADIQKEVIDLWRVE